jgi:hypothetical protein
MARLIRYRKKPRGSESEHRSDSFASSLGELANESLVDRIANKVSVVVSANASRSLASSLYELAYPCIYALDVICEHSADNLRSSYLRDDFRASPPPYTDPTD